MDEYKEQARASFEAIYKKTHLMRSDVAKLLGVNERTIVRWTKGITSIDYAYYLRLVDFVNNSHTTPRA